jgi:hypothetical protein
MRTSPTRGVPGGTPHAMMAHRAGKGRESTACFPGDGDLTSKELIMVIKGFLSDRPKCEEKGLDFTGVPLPCFQRPCGSLLRPQAAKSVGLREKTWPVWFTPLMFVRLLPEVHKCVYFSYPQPLMEVQLC